MTPADLARLRALCDAATPGPWTAYCRDVGNPTGNPDWPTDSFLQFEIGGPAEVWGRGDFVGHDAAFIAAARDAVPMLLDEVERLNGIIKVASDFSVAEVARAEKAEALLRDLVAQIDHEGNADHRLGAFRLGLVIQMIRDHLAEKGDPA